VVAIVIYIINDIRDSLKVQNDIWRTYIGILTPFLTPSKNVEAKDDIVHK
jgi:hypothetical protein